MHDASPGVSTVHVIILLHRQDLSQTRFAVRPGTIVTADEVEWVQLFLLILRSRAQRATFLVGVVNVFGKEGAFSGQALSIGAPPHLAPPTHGEFVKVQVRSQQGSHLLHTRVVTTGLCGAE